LRYFLKVIVAKLFSATPLIGALLFFGVCLLCLSRHKKVGRRLVMGSAFLLLLFSYDPLPEFLLNHHEMSYPALSLEHLPAQEKALITHVVVLAGGFHPAADKPLTTNLTPSTLVRLIEGLRLFKKLTHSKLVFSGKGWAEQSEAAAMAELALALGIAKKDMILDPDAANTFQHTQYIKPIVGSNAFVLVTSAMHMPRAMAMFKKAGMFPIAAPTGHLLTGNYRPFSLSSIYPTGDNLAAMDIWFYEFWGSLWAKLRGQI